MSVISHSSYQIDSCSPELFEAVKKHIRELELDDRQMIQEQFLIATVNNRLAGFGRVREFNGFSEMCSLGVLPGQRLQGLGITLVQHLIKKATQPIYMVCIIPSFFERLGFRICDHYPEEMQQKLDYCTNSLAVPEPYVVMTNQ